MNPRSCLRWVALTLSVVLMLAGGLAIQAGPAATEKEGGFEADDSAANSANQSGRAPSLAFGSPTPGGQPEPWLAFVESNKIVAAQFSAGAWQRRGGALNFQLTNSAGKPSFGFAGASHTVPWAAFVETIGGKQQILAAKFEANSWQRIGLGIPPSLNHDTTQNADDPSLAGSGALTSTTSVPWVAWDETTSSGRQVFVKRLSGAWQAVGAALGNTQNSSSNPDLIFSGAGNATAWTVWQEQGSGQASRIFAAQTDDGGASSWTLVGSTAGCTGAGCALNFNPDSDASTPRVASGALPGEPAPTPWVVFAEQVDGVSQIFVERLDPAAQNRFLLVGNHQPNRPSGSLNVTPGENATDPDIFFVGQVPHVSWTEQQNGVSTVFVAHLADARPGSERWDLDSPMGINRAFFQPAARPAIGSNGTTPYVAWQEGITTTNIFAAHRYPDGPAWGSNRPPFIRIISGTFRLASMTLTNKRLPSTAVSSADLMGPAEITTSCYHADGWDNISAIEFKLADTAGTIFRGKYVAAENKVYVENPENPGTFLPPGTPGSGAPIETANVLLDVPNMPQPNVGISTSSVLDIKWILYFKPPTFKKDYVQSINIIYKSSPGTSQASTSRLRTPQQAIIETGFFRVGAVSVSQRVMLPLIRR